MPYQNETASKTAHADLIKDPSVARYINECRYLAPLNSGKCQTLASSFVPVSQGSILSRDIKLVAYDGSRCEVSLCENIPFTRFGFLQVNCVNFTLHQFRSLRENGLANPFMAAELQKQKNSLQFCVAGSNLLWRDYPTVQQSFRATLEQLFWSSGLIDTLFLLGTLRAGYLQSPDAGTLLLHSCPNCDGGPVTIKKVETPQLCPRCSAPVYATDVLRLWEEVSENESNESVLTRTSLVLEHLWAIHHLHLKKLSAPGEMNRTVVCMDGPLAMFGPPCAFHSPIQNFLFQLRQKFPGLLVMGIQKTGQVVDHATQLASHLTPGSLLSVTDSYRYSNIVLSRDPAERFFGRQSHYGQDFIYFSREKKIFVFSLPYCAPTKDGKFPIEKSKIENYPQLGQAVQLLEELASDLYPNAFTPTILAHNACAISEAPGGALLADLSKAHLPK